MTSLAADRPGVPETHHVAGPRFDASPLTRWLEVPNIRPRSEQFAVPLLVSVLLLLATFLVERLTGATIPLLLVAAVALTAWYDGVLAGLASALALTFLIALFVIPPAWGFSFEESEDVVRMATFLVVALITVFPMSSLALTQTRNRRLAREREGLIEELRDLAAAKDEFLGMVSHELRTPLTTILGNAEVLRARWDTLDVSDREAALGDVAEESARLQGIVENLLLLARVEGTTLPEPEPIIVVRTVERVIARLRRFAIHREFRIIEHGEARAVLAIPMYVERVVENYLSNAMKYSPRDEPITIDISRSAGWVEVRVMDRGPGIKEEEVEELFTAFFRSKADVSRAAGIGIGLTVCKRLIEAQGGEVWAKRLPERGSEFGFRVHYVEIGSDDAALGLLEATGVTR